MCIIEFFSIEIRISLKFHYPSSYYFKYKYKQNKVCVYSYEIFLN